MRKNLLGILLMLCMVFTLLPKTALAGEDGYSYDAETKVLTITTNAEATNSAAWKQDATGIKANVTAIIVADTVTTIGMNAFYNCPQLTSVAIGKNVVNMDIGAFSTAPKLSTLTVAAENTAYKAVNNVLFSYDGTKLVRYPEGLTNTSYTVPDGVKTIYSNAFYKNAYITDISLPDSVTELGYQAFFYCTKLSSMNIPATVTKLGDSLLSNTALTSIAIPAGVTEIPFNAFAGCPELTSVAIGEGVTSIDNNAFTRCPKLNTFTVAAGSSSYKAVENVLLTKDGTTLVKYPEGLTALSYTVPDNVETIGSRAFYENPRLTTVIFANSVTEIAEGAFHSCTELTTVDLGESLHTIGNSAFSGCSKLSSVDLPATVTTIGNNAFYTTKLSAITIPAGVTSIGDYAFYSTSLVTVTIPAAVTSIGDYAFAYCSQLKTVIMDSDTAPTIGEKVFYSSNNTIIYTSIGATGYDAANWPSGKVVEGRAWLSALSLSGITLSPDFATATTSYTASVGNSVGSTTVTPTMAAGTGITVNGTAVASGSTSNAILLNGGDNIITVVVANSSYPTETQTYTITVTKVILIPETTPTATFTATGADGGTLTNVTTAMKYSVNGGTTWLSITDTTMNITGVTAANGVKLYQPGNTTTTTDSAEQTITVTKAGTPSAGKTDCTTLANNNGKLTGVTTAMEYKLSTAGSWTSGTGSDITNLANATYNVRVKATGTVLASETQNLTIAAYTATSETTPTATFTATGADSGTLTNVTTAMKYSVNGGSTWLSITAATMNISGITAANGVKVYQPGNNTTTTDSAEQTITVTKALIPSAGKANCTTLANNDGKLTSVTALMEYSANGTSWNDCGGTEITNLTNGTYHVRVKAIGTVLASEAQSLTIAAYTGTPETTPTATFTATGADSGTLSNVTTAMKFSINDGTSWLSITDTTMNISGITAANGVRVYQPGNNTTTLDSAEQTITVTKAATPTTAGKTDCTTTANNDGKLTGVTTEMEYKLSTAGGWASGDGNDITNLTNGTYNVRVKASGTMLASETQNLTIAAYNAPSSGGGNSATVTRIDNGGTTTGSNLDKLISSGKTLTVDGDNGAKLVFDTEALKEIERQTAGSIQVEMKNVSPAHQDNHPGKQVFSLTVSSGSSTISNFSGAVTVSLPYTLNEGESVEAVTVWYLANDGTMTEIPCTYDAVTQLATFKVTHFSLYVVGVDTPWANPFSDVAESDWFYSAVKFACLNNLMQGTDTTLFSPAITTNRAMLITILWRLENKPAAAQTVDFSDVADGAWYSGAVAWAAANGIVTGYDGKFNPENTLTREQMAMILYRYAAYKGEDVSNLANLSVYADAPSSWATVGVRWAVAKGLIQGIDNNLEPTDSATRAQAATILQRFLEGTAK